MGVEGITAEILIKSAANRARRVELDGLCQKCHAVGQRKASAIQQTLSLSDSQTSHCHTFHSHVPKSRSLLTRGSAIRVLTHTMPAERAGVGLVVAPAGFYSNFLVHRNHVHRGHLHVHGEHQDSRPPPRSRRRRAHSRDDQPRVVAPVCQAQDTRDGVSTSVEEDPANRHQIFNGRKTDQCGVIVFGSEGNISPTLAVIPANLSPRNLKHDQRETRRLRERHRVHPYRSTQSRDARQA
jgi:hypothetical protein